MAGRGLFSLRTVACMGLRRETIDASDNTYAGTFLTCGDHERTACDFNSWPRRR